MYDLRPPYVLILDEVLQDPLMAVRAERMLAALPPGTPREVVSLDELPAAAEAHEWHRKGGSIGMPPREGDGGWFFGKMRWDGLWPERWAAIKAAWPQAPGVLRKAYGYDAFEWFSSSQDELKPCADHVCRPAWRIHLVYGCPHKCFYCGLQDPLTFMLNVEEYIPKLAELSAKNPWQKTWLYEDDSEALAQEPEFGGLPAIMEFCAQSADNYVIIHTKSANVDWMKDLPHNGRTILTWSLTGPTQSSRMEPGSATCAERIEAARKCQSWGYTVRYKFKPIVPVIGWQDELRAMTRMVFDRTRPDSISLFTLAWMDYAHFCRIVDTSMIDPRFLAAAEAAAESMGKSKVRPFPDELRREVYEFCLHEIRRYDTEIPVTICTESLAVWQELGPLLGLTPGNYPCGCGPQALPNLKELPDSPWRVARPVPVDGDRMPVVK